MRKDNPLIVLVDDDKAHTVLAKRSLRKHGIANEIILFHSGEQLLDFVFSEQNLVDKVKVKTMVLILDINIPGINGIDVLKKVKTSELSRHIPVIILTTTDEIREINQCYASGCNAYVVKPVDHAKFVEMIKYLGLFLEIIQYPCP